MATIRLIRTEAYMKRRIRELNLRSEQEPMKGYSHCPLCGDFKPARTMFVNAATGRKVGCGECLMERCKP
jgi:transcription elongation factor Elf1